AFGVRVPSQYSRTSGDAGCQYTSERLRISSTSAGGRRRTISTPSHTVVSPPRVGGSKQANRQISGRQGSRESSGWSGKGLVPRLTDCMFEAASSSARFGLSLNTDAVHQLPAKSPK